MSEEKPVRQVGVKIVKADNFGETPTVFVESQKPIEKSDKSEQLSMVNAVNASEWITHPIDMRGLKELVDNSTILPQCIRAYKSNIAGFGISVGYCEDYEEETTEMQAEYVIYHTHNRFDTEEYEKELPQDVRMAVILLAEAYAKQAITQKEGAKSSETFDDYSYTMDNDSDIAENLGLALMLDDYIIQPDNGKVTMKLRKL